MQQPFVRRAWASAPGKVVLLGEYAVLEGAPALVMAVDRRAVADAERVEQSESWRIEAPTLGLTTHLSLKDPAADSGSKATRPLALARAIVADWLACDRLGASGGILRLDSGAFFHHDQKLGLGSSAAVAVAAWHALRALTGGNPRSAPLAQPPLSGFDEVLALHQAAQGGQGSGIDVAASTLGGMVRFELERASAAPWDPACDAAAIAARLEGRNPLTQAAKRRGTLISPVKMPQELSLTLVWTGRPAKTQDFLGAFARLKQEASSLYWQHLEELAALSHGGLEMWHLGHVGALLPLINRYHDAMLALGKSLNKEIVTPEHARIAKVVRQAKGAYKPSGAGGGDIGIALTPRGLATLKLRLSLLRHRISTLPLRLDTQGVVRRQPDEPGQILATHRDSVRHPEA